MWLPQVVRGLPFVFQGQFMRILINLLYRYYLSNVICPRAEKGVWVGFWCLFTKWEFTMSQSVKVLLPKHEYWSLNSQNHVAVWA